VQDLLNDTTLVVIISSAIILLFTVAYVYTLMSSNNRIIDEQQKKIDEIKKSEQRYKALFENSLAGMMKLSFAPLIIFEANRTILDMFNTSTEYDLQRVLSDLPRGQIDSIESALRSHGIIEAFEIEFATVNGIKRRFLLSAKKEESENLAHAVVVLMNSEKLIG
jgi:PAS domain-containing protein